MTQLVTRVGDELAAAIDLLVKQGVVESRSEAVRRGLEMLVDRHRRAGVAAAIVRGYQAHPQAGEEAGWADAATRRMIAEEPW
jgi:Arc/MetJ-type ribon-helix-helix transcriptional regulator